MRSITVLLISITLSLSLAPPLAAQDRSYPSPTLEPLLEGDEGYVRSDYFGAPRRHIDGMAVELDETRLTYPLAGSIFFEEGSADLPERSIRSSSPAEVVGFTDTTIPGGTLQKYTRILDILGFRMRSHAGARITLTGCVARGESGGLARLRGERVRDYLTAIWGIAPERIALDPSARLPRRPSDPDDPLGNAENARVDIRTSDPALLAPVVSVDRRFLPQPDSVRFRMGNGIPDSLVADRWIEITRNGHPWHVLRNLGVAAPISSGYNWGRDGVDYALSTDEHPYVARLVVRDRTGGEHRSNEVTIPVTLITPSDLPRERWVDTTIDIYLFLFFPFDSARLTPTDRAWLGRLIHSPGFPPLAPPRIEVVGHTDIIGPEGYNQALSERRARAVASALREVRGRRGYSTISVLGMGEADPLYPNDLPEGRFYNRTAVFRLYWSVP